MANHSNYSENSSSVSSICLPQYWKEPLGVMTVRLLFEVAVASFGVLGNIAVFLVLSSRRSHVHMNSAMKTFVLNLAAADLCVLLLNFPLAVVNEQSPLQWLLGEFICLYIFPLCDVFYGVSIWSLMAVAIERYRIVNGTSLIRPNSAKALFIWLAILWIVPFFIIVFPLLLHMKYSAEHKQCYVRWSTNIFDSVPQLYTNTQFIFWFLLPLFTICWTYCKIGKWITRSLRVQLRPRSSTVDSDVDRSSPIIQMQKNARIKQSSKAKRLLTPLVLVFVVTMTPTFAFRLLAVYVPNIICYRYSLVLYSCLIILTVINSAINPAVYCVASREFRLGMKQILVRCLRNARLSIYRTR